MTGKHSGTYTLECLTDSIVRQGHKNPEERIHAASMLSMLSSVSEVLGSTTLPMPLYAIGYDSDRSKVEFYTLDGESNAPEDHISEIGLQELLFAANMRDKLQLLLEGITGVGKTFITEHYMETVFPSENFDQVRLDPNTSNVLQSYTYSANEKGRICQYIKKEKLDSIGALFVDEINRGKSNQVMMLLDGEIILGTGERGKIGIQIPEYENDTWKISENRRPLFLVAAQNPPATRNAKYTGTRANDAAQNNRMLRLNIPNSASHVGSSQNFVRTIKDKHSAFIDLYKESMKKMLQVSDGDLENLENEWMSVYAFTTNPEKTNFPNTRSAHEFQDVLSLMLSPDLTEYYERQAETLQKIGSSLKSYGVFSYSAKLSGDPKTMHIISGLVNTFEEQYVKRDISRVNGLADLLGVINRARSAFQSTDPLQSYLDHPKFITMQESAGAFAILLENKQAKKDQNPNKLVDTVLQQYKSIAEGFATSCGYFSEADIDSPTLSVYNFAMQHAFQEADKGQIKSKAFIEDLGKSCQRLIALEGGVEYKKPMLQRFITDIATLAHFVDKYKNETEIIFSGQSISDKRQGLQDFYVSVRNQPFQNSIYSERLRRVLGV